MGTSTSLGSDSEATVINTGEATLTAATRVVFNDGFTVADGGQLVAGTDPTLSGNTTKTYGYHPTEYFLTSADGPWGSLEWTYDRIGNRTSETNSFGTDVYSYDKNGASGTGGNTALLRTITPALGGSRNFGYTPAGHQTMSGVTWLDATQSTTNPGISLTSASFRAAALTLGDSDETSARLSLAHAGWVRLPCTLKG